MLLCNYLYSSHRFSGTFTIKQGKMFTAAFWDNATISAVAGRHNIAGPFGFVRGSFLVANSATSWFILTSIGRRTKTALELKCSSHAIPGNGREMALAFR